MSTSAKCRLLVAATAMGYRHARRALLERFELVAAFSSAQALAALRQQRIDAVLCSIHFDDSRMIELLHEVRAAHPDVPFVCCQMLASQLSAECIQGIAAAARSQGALAFIDYNAVLRSAGTTAADRHLRDELLRLLPLQCAPVAAPSPARAP